MPAFSFYKFSPSGNTTLFLIDNINVNSSHYCRLALDQEGICAEQCGTVELASYTLQMGAGEFCANACRAFGALLALEEKAAVEDETLHYNIKVSGSSEPVGLKVKGKIPFWEVAAAFSIIDTHIEIIDKNIILVRLPGISHLLLSNNWPNFSEISTLAREARLAFLPSDCPASGIIWWKENNGVLDILPHVEVPASGTSMLESSCGSASLALALSLAQTSAQKFFSIRQPHGDILSICLDGNNKATLAGGVRLCAKGTIFLPSP